MNRTGNNPTPRWVKVFVAIGILLFLAFVVLHLTGYGPGGHHQFSSHFQP